MATSFDSKEYAERRRPEGLTDLEVHEKEPVIEEEATNLENESFAGREVSDIGRNFGSCLLRGMDFKLVCCFKKIRNVNHLPFDWLRKVDKKYFVTPTYGFMNLPFTLDVQGLQGAIVKSGGLNNRAASEADDEGDTLDIGEMVGQDSNTPTDDSQNPDNQTLLRLLDYGEKVKESCLVQVLKLLLLSINIFLPFLCLNIFC